jgi:hypothetical protein
MTPSIDHKATMSLRRAASLEMQTLPLPLSVISMSPNTNVHNQPRTDVPPTFFRIKTAMMSAAVSGEDLVSHSPWNSIADRMWLNFLYDSYYNTLPVLERAVSRPVVGSGRIVGNMTDGPHGGILNIGRVACGQGGDCDTPIRRKYRDRILNFTILST